MAVARLKAAPLHCDPFDGPAAICDQEASFAPADQTGALMDGALAQLGERLHGMQEVSGSIPLGSTITIFHKI